MSPLSYLLRRNKIYPAVIPIDPSDLQPQSVAEFPRAPSVRKRHRPLVELDISTGKRRYVHQSARRQSRHVNKKAELGYAPDNRIEHTSIILKEPEFFHFMQRTLRLVGALFDLGTALGRRIENLLRHPSVSIREETGKLTVQQQIWIAPDGACEMRVEILRKAEMPDIASIVAGPFERPEHHDRNRTPEGMPLYFQAIEKSVIQPQLDALEKRIKTLSSLEKQTVYKVSSPTPKKEKKEPNMNETKILSSDDILNML